MWFVSMTLLVTLTKSSPVLEGKDVGSFLHLGSAKLLHNPGKYPHLVLLKMSEVTFKSQTMIEENVITCGGILIKLDTVLTAAHCLTLTEAAPKISVTAGMVDRNLEASAEIIPVQEYYIHENYVNFIPQKYPNKQLFHLNDIAILWLSRSFYPSWKIKPANLADSHFVAGNEIGGAAGWGLTSTGYESIMLQETELRVISRDECASAYPSIGIPNTVLCGIADNRRSTVCIGDSGGSFVVKGTVVGISSWGEKLKKTRSDGQQIISCDPTKPVIFTKISEYRTWINKNIAAGRPSLRGCKKFYGSHRN